MFREVEFQESRGGKRIKDTQNIMEIAKESWLLWFIDA